MVVVDFNAAATSDKLKNWGGSQGSWRRHSRIASSHMKMQVFFMFLMANLADFPSYSACRLSRSESDNNCVTDFAQNIRQMCIAKIRIVKSPWLCSSAGPFRMDAHASCGFF
jgi:hypothetical protein